MSYNTIYTLTDPLPDELVRIITGYTDSLFDLRYYRFFIEIAEKTCGQSLSVNLGDVIIVVDNFILDNLEMLKKSVVDLGRRVKIAAFYTEEVSFNTGLINKIIDPDKNIPHLLLTYGQHVIIFSILWHNKDIILSLPDDI